jgi:hypothetical protein
MRTSRYGTLLWFYRIGSAVLLCTASAMAWSSPLTPLDEQQISTVVQSQLSAFAKDDAAAAFSYAAPNIRKQLGNASNFMDMVRNRYEVIYRPSSVVLFKPQGEGAQAILKVQLTDDAGALWIAIYTLQRQKNKSWRISGCVVNESTGTFV